MRGAAERRQVPLRALAARGALGGVWQRVRARHAQQPRWARRHLLLAHNLLYAYREPQVRASAAAPAPGPYEFEIKTYHH